MISYTMKKVEVEQLILDEKNPRFIVPPNPSQQSIVDYLIEYEEVVKLAMSIRDNGGLFAGERVIVYEEDGKYIVLEGNRRVCACKILLNPNLLSNKMPATISEIKDTVSDSLKKEISELYIDVMPSRVNAQSSLAAKHIEGIKRWSTISKYKFVSLEFSAGRSIEEISMITGITPTKIRNGLKEYRLIEYALNLKYWTEQERREFLNLQEIKTTRFTRLFSAKAHDETNMRLREIIKLSYDSNFNVLTSLDREVFDNVIHIVAQAAFNPEYCPNFSTRSTYEEIPQLMDFFEENSISTYNKLVNDTIKGKSADESNTNRTNIRKNKDYNNNAEDARPKNGGDITKSNVKYTSRRNVLIPEDFTVNCKVTKINDIIFELKKLSFNYCVNAQAVLLRVLVELSLKFYLTKIDEKDKINEKNLDGTFCAVLEIMRKNNEISNAEHKNLTQIRKNNQIFNIFNGYVHYDSVVPNKEVLIFYFDNFRKLIEICLNS